MSRIINILGDILLIVGSLGLLLHALGLIDRDLQLLSVQSLALAACSWHVARRP